MDAPAEQTRSTVRAGLREAARAARPALLRTLLCVLGAAIVGVPLALSWAVTHTRVETQIGTAPTTLTLTVQGRSELRLGVAGTVYVPESQGPLGVVATVQGPGDPGGGSDDLADFVSPRMLQLYAGLYRDPEAAVAEYVTLVEQDLTRRFVRAEVSIAVAGGLALDVLCYLLPLRRLRRGRADTLRMVATGGVVLACTTTLAVFHTNASDPASTQVGEFPLTTLDGTLAEGSTTNSPVLRALLGGALDKTRQLVDRQGEQTSRYLEQARQGLEEAADQVAGPEDGELAILVQSDMHCNNALIDLQGRVHAMLRDLHGDDVPALLAIAGDLTTNGTAAEGTCIRDEAAIADGGPVAAITGNHESDISEQQMADAGMTVLDGETEEVGGVRLLGDGDPSRSELFGSTRQRGEEGQQDVGERLYREAEDAGSDDRPDVLMVHEGYAAAAFMGVDDVRALLEEPGTTTEPSEDGVRDLPTSAIFYGHWHRSVEPRVLWNDDGTWTLLMELDTSGGAIATPTFNNFSVPWSRPQQAASFPVVFLDEETRLVTGYQLYRFAVDGTVTIEPRVDVGAP